MNDPDNFLARWSRRKSVAGKTLAKAPDQLAGASEPAIYVRLDIPPARAASDRPIDERAPNTGAAPEPVFDPAGLPSIDSIGAETDISAFLKPGVPSDLRHAALRRAWSADPAIRDFKGLQENDWNFNDPTGIPGFGELSPNTDVKKMLGELFGESPREHEPSAELPAPTEQHIPLSDVSGAASEEVAPQAGGESTRDSKSSDPTGIAKPASEEMMHCKKDIAAQERDAGVSDAPTTRRRSHGGALPH
jgi:hypothetical protein